MSQKPTIPSQYLPQPCGASPRITVFTNSTDPLFLVFTFNEPKRKPRFKVIRGLRYECGRQWELTDVLCLAQINIPTNKYHVFALPTAPLGTCAWYSLTTSCSLPNASSFSPPIKYCYQPCDVTGGFIEMTRCPVTELGTDYSLAFADITNGNPAMKVNNLTIKALVDGTYQCDANAIMRADPAVAGNYTGELYFRRSDGTEFGHSAPYSTNQNEQVSVAASGSIYVFANQLITVHTRRLSGTNFVQRSAGLNTDSRWSVSAL